MANVQVMSDLHFEFMGDRGEKFVEALDSTGVDVLILAGDIQTVRSFEETRKVLKRFCDKYPMVLYVPGNHEYYDTEAWVTDIIFSNLDLPNLKVLNNEVVTVGGTRFLGGTMWFPRDTDAWYYRKDLNDFELIKDFIPWVYDKNAAFQVFLEKELQEGDVVITHHLPSRKSIAPMFEKSPLNGFFLCDQERLIYERRPKLWVHGHTHFGWDYRLGNTRVVCNPRGYPHEFRGPEMFVKRFIVEI